MQSKNRNYFRLCRFIILRLPPVFKFLRRFRTPAKRLLIVKIDAIGDYVLFRNFIELSKKSSTFCDYQIDLIGNKTWADLAFAYDGKFIGNYYFVNPDELYEQPGKLLALAWRLFKNNYALVLHPTFSRTLIGDGLACLPAAIEITGFEGDFERINPHYKRITDRRYTRLLQLPSGISFEFDGYKFFFETILRESVDLKTPFLPTLFQSRNGIIVFPGAGVSKRCWEKEKFLEIIRRIIHSTTDAIILAGGTDDRPTGNWLANQLPAERIINRIGVTSLTELVGLIGNARLLISNETSAVHIAAATQTPSVCILGGGHFGRFAPYPVSSAGAPVCVFEKMSCYNCNW